MLRTLIFAVAGSICMSFGLMSFQKACVMKKQSTGCQYWQSKVDAEVGPPASAQKTNETDPQTILDGIACLLQMEGNKHSARFSGATKPYVSQIFKPATVDIAALYYISYLYHQRWDHADAVALRDESGEVNSPRAIPKAYKSYRKWFEEVKKIGLSKAREMKLDPLKDAKVRWY
jgi:hypothetical protein